MKEQEARKKVKALKGLYMDVLTYVFVNMILILLWLTFDRGGLFWPKYVIVIWGIVLGFKAYRKDVIPLVLHHISFLTPEWETKKIRELKGHHPVQRKVHLNRRVKK